MRNVLHDWPDVKCQEILRNIGTAMTPGSQIWIDEVVVPDRKATQAHVEWDWTMLVAVAGMERSTTQWRTLVEQSGFAVVEFYPVDVERGAAVIIIEPKTAN
jgi:demethylsterigmatocystin 6-O-methyltransferase